MLRLQQQLRFPENSLVACLVRGKLFLLTVGGFLLTVKLFCLQSIKVLIRGTFPL